MGFQAPGLVVEEVRSERVFDTREKVALPRIELLLVLFDLLVQIPFNALNIIDAAAAMSQEAHAWNALAVGIGLLRKNQHVADAVDDIIIILV